MTTVFTMPACGSIAVEAPRAECEWLTAFLTPAFSPAPDTPDTGARVRLVDAPAPPPSSGAGDRIAFVLDRHPMRLPETVASNALVYADPELQVSYAARNRGRDVAVHRGPRSDLTRMAVMRVVREYAQNTLLDGGGLVIHAAAFAGPRGAVLLTGPKGVGKTTLLARMLSRSGVSYLANDRVGVAPEGSKALAIPTIVAVRSGTRRLLPELGERLRGLSRFTALEQPGGEPPDRTSDSWYFSPRQLAAAVPCELIGNAPIAAVVALTPEAPSGAMRQASPAEAVDLLANSLLGAHAGVFMSEVFRSTAPRPAAVELLRDRCRRLAGDVPCFTLPAPVSFDRATLDGLQSLCA